MPPPAWAGPSPWANNPGDRICRNAGIKNVTMQLEANSPHFVMSGAGLENVASATVSSGFANAGQAHISTQRVLAGRRIHAGFPDALAAPVRAYDAKGRMSTV